MCVSMEASTCSQLQKLRLVIHKDILISSFSTKESESRWMLNAFEDLFDARPSLEVGIICMFHRNSPSVVIREAQWEIIQTLQKTGMFKIQMAYFRGRGRWYIEENATFNDDGIYELTG